LCHNKKSNKIKIDYFSKIKERVIKMENNESFLEKEKPKKSLYKS